MEKIMTKDHLHQIILVAKGFYARKDRAHDLDHALRVRAWGIKLAQEEGADVTIIELAALLHDIGRSGAVEKTHAESSAGLAVNILQKHGYPDNIVRKVKEAVISHSRQAGHEPATLEAKVLYDADKLDFVGAIGLGRLFTMGGVHRWPIIGENSCESFYQERIRRYKEHLFTKTGIKYFEPLLLYMEEFWRELHAERLNSTLSGYAKSV